MGSGRSRPETLRPGELRRFALALAVLVLVACEDRSGSFPNPPSVTVEAPPPLPSAIASPTPPALPETPLPTEGKRSADCVQGWFRPLAGSKLERRPLRLIRRTVGLPGTPVIVDMRYFSGPESPPSEKGYLAEIQRWYVKLYVEEDLRFQGRFLVESREFGSGVVAVAPYDTEGFRSPDWSGFQWDAGSPEPRAYPGLPGRWAGVRYDFVRGGAGLGFPGLPAQVSGCLDSS
jgi:hypothetical protein